MARRQINPTEQLPAGSLTRALLNTSLAGSAVIAKVLASNGVTVFASTGADSGTGDVTLRLGVQVDSLTIATANTVPALSKTQAGPLTLLVVNGIVFAPVGASPPFTVSGTVITWSATNSGVPLASGDIVVAIYSY